MIILYILSSIIFFVGFVTSLIGIFRFAYWLKEIGDAYIESHKKFKIE